MFFGGNWQPKKTYSSGKLAIGEVSGRILVKAIIFQEPSNHLYRPYVPENSLMERCEHFHKIYVTD